MKTIKRILSSYKTSVVLLIIYAVILAAATFVEKYHGTDAAKALIYYSPLFMFLHFLMVLNFIFIVFKHKLFNKSRLGLLLVHFSFIIILLGALFSHLTAKEGYIHLRAGEKSNKMIVQTRHGMVTHEFPFEIELVKFNLTRYPGSSSPSSYESELLLYVDGKTKQEKVYMNNVLDVKGYRFFQASYDKDEMGTILSVNKDVTGRNITYAGYLILFIGFIFCFTGKNSRIRILSRQLNKIKNIHKTIIITAFLFLSFNTEARNNSHAPILDTVTKYAVNKNHAARFGEIPVQSARGRIMPVNTFSSEILRKIHKSDKMGTLNSDQFLLSFLTMPDLWIRVPFIKVSDKEVADYFGLTNKECAYIEFFDNSGIYKLQNKVDEAYNKNLTDRNSFDKEVLKLDEKVNILNQLLNGLLLNIFPNEDDAFQKWYSAGDDLSVFSGKDSMFVSRIMDWYLMEIGEAVNTGDWSKANEVLDMIVTYQNAKGGEGQVNYNKLKTEMRYNKLKIFHYCKISYLLFGGMLLVIVLLLLFKNNNRFIGVFKRVFVSLVIITFGFHTIGTGMRWYIAGHAPWSNSYETMVYVAWATVLGGLLFIRRNIIVFALATLFAGIILFVSGLNFMDPQISPLVPVLKSPWLMFHVAVIVAAYGFFGISFLIGLTNLILMTVPKKLKFYGNIIRELSIINEMSLIIGLALMTIGTFLGAVWANESWGRYWGWDPKETWALITIIVYVIVTHLHLVHKIYNLWIFNLLSVVAFSSVLMTFFGVNYFLSGMHSYGQSSGINEIFIYLYIAGFIILLLAIFSFKNIKTIKDKTA